MEGRVENLLYQEHTKSCGNPSVASERFGAGVIFLAPFFYPLLLRTPSFTEMTVLLGNSRPRKDPPASEATNPP